MHEPGDKETVRAGQSWRTWLVSWVWLGLLLGELNGGGGQPQVSGGDTNVPFRFGFSNRIFTDVDENDVRAAIKVWAQVLANERSVAVDMQPMVLKGAEAIASALRENRLDALVLTTPEYEVASRDYAFSRFLLGVYDGSVSEEYVLLTRRQAGLATLAQLRGRTLAVFDNSRMSLASVWLETELPESGPDGLERYFGRVTASSKCSQPILRVFFGQADACLVTRRGFETMGELNPQLSEQLRVVARSPALVPNVFCFRADFSARVKDRLLAEIARVHTSPAAAQVMTLFQCDRLEERAVEELAPSLALLERHHRRLGTGRRDLPAGPEGGAGTSGKVGRP